MGWTAGSELGEKVWSLVREFVPAERRQAVALKVIDLFEAEDCDTMHEAEQLMSDTHNDFIQN